jgi:hypothetical protein
MIGKRLERIIVGKEDVTTVFTEVNNELTETAKPVVEALKTIEV